MGLKEIAAKLDWLLDAPKNRTSKQAEAIDLLVAQLIEKEAKYKVKLGLVQTARERKILERKIRVSSAQIAKGRAAAHAMRAESDNHS